ncbi:VC2046/SO_2500 family protein [Oceanisphaera avium]|uniref:QueD like 2 n=1 Tax=Oceanisphaera avium TaxID=1903694 RepID=A0A1Y0CUE3_9GAMM|nr:VC2046/SO_2500 family protein [Oceanisphaera avium]ART78859.1 hypothetical protein CBP12_00730 [Oceanisphaera avium]
MLTETHNSLLVNDSQLGDRLNHAVADGRRSDFGLLLAMLSDDARDLPRIEADKDEQGQINWRQYFELPNAEPLYAEEQDTIRAPQLSALANELQQDSLRLMLAMRAEPLRVDHAALPYEVNSNLSPRTQARFAGEQLNRALPQDASRMLDIIESVKAMA